MKTKQKTKDKEPQVETKFSEKHKIISLKPVMTEKAVMIIEKENTLIFMTEKNIPRNEIKKEIENLFEVKVENVRTLIRGNKKRVYVKLKKEFPAIDLATKLGMM